MVPLVGKPSVMPTVNRQTEMNEDVTTCNKYQIKSLHNQKCDKVVNKKLETAHMVGRRSPM